MTSFDEESVKKLECGHVLHNGCVRKVIQCAGTIYDAKCPLCRAPMKKQPNRSKEMNRRDWEWDELQRIEDDWTLSIEEVMSEDHDETDTFQFQRSYGQWDVEETTDQVVARVRDQELRIVNERHRSVSIAHAVWHAYEEQATEETLRANTRARAAWKQYEDHMVNEISGYESRTMAAWLEQEYRIEIDRRAVESQRMH